MTGVPDHSFTKRKCTLFSACNTMIETPETWTRKWSTICRLIPWETLDKTHVVLKDGYGATIGTNPAVSAARERMSELDHSDYPYGNLLAHTSAIFRCGHDVVAGIAGKVGCRDIVSATRAVTRCQRRVAETLYTGCEGRGYHCLCSGTMISCTTTMRGIIFRFIFMLCDIR
jgi:hypothetical protein